MLLGFQFQSPGVNLFTIGPLTVRWYGFLIASAVLIGVTLSQYLAKRRQVNPDLIGDLVIWLVLAAIFSARLYYVVFQWQEYAQHPGDIIAIWKGGIAIHGAILGGTLATIFFARFQRISVWQLADLVVPSLTLGQTIGRWGNFFNSEAFGSPTNLPWKLYIPPSNRPLKYLNQDYFHPTFLYESIWNLLLFILLLLLFFWDQLSLLLTLLTDKGYQICCTINHRFDECLAHEWLRCARERVLWGDSSQTSLSLILCHLDRLELEDSTLKKLAQSLTQIVKRPSDLVARYREQEFAVLLPNTDEAGAMRVVELIQAEIRSLTPMTLSFGLVTGIPTRALPPFVLVEAAFQALQQAIQAGGDRLVSDRV